MERGTLKTAQLQMLVAIAEQGTLMAAADALNVSQPAVTKSIKELEARLGVQLLERSGAGVRLTRYGEALLRRARTVVTEIARAERELEEMKSGVERTLSIGVSLLASSMTMDDALRAFRRRLPDVRLNVYECLPAQIIDGLRDGSFDLCVAFVADSDVTAEYRVVPLAESAQVLAVPSGDPLARETKLARLTKARWLYNYTRDSLPAFWRELCGDGATLAMPLQVNVCTSQRLYTQLADEPGTVSVWPAFLLQEQIKLGRMQRLATDARTPRLTLGLMYRRELVLGASLEYFVECLRNASATSENANADNR
ncbi:LysR family transcriptional regulator [Paraburkholderia sp. D15]|uniref:LysR family transcriptional regulator n=1 Tax=Paraburkholderia sp. D15 TaxID=2880218 RepID=UPI002479B7ED|nr:LysR family transcriptional regulator [Paraburkholderia sp. D15]WGS54310.1 LysR family transcriptional regulator [Paraburkholderia sp. D15]